MPLYLVVSDTGSSIELRLSSRLEQAMILQSERLRDAKSRDSFAQRMEERVEALLEQAIDWDLKKPTSDDISYLKAVGELLGIQVPERAMHFVGEMHAFLEEPTSGLD